MKRWLVFASLGLLVLGCSSGPEAEIEAEKPAKGQATKDMGSEASGNIESVKPDSQ
ncbi:MAG: hypothetical protein JNM34_07445 [Chthonomonadaceae bacterium]|nr:hypothetical protein [Chthonomonadaceae bacterium]